jgi:hypothetical protein
MSNITHHYTPEEINDNYEFKVVKKALMREYPWVKNVSVDANNLPKYNLIFLDIDIDPIMLGEEMGWELTPWVQKAIEQGKEYKGMYLSLFYDGVSFEESKDLTNDMTDLIRSVGPSPAFPPDLRIKGDRKFAIGDFYVNKGMEPWF